MGLRRKNISWAFFVGYTGVYYPTSWGCRSVTAPYGAYNIMEAGKKMHENNHKHFSYQALKVSKIVHWRTSGRQRGTGSGVLGGQKGYPNVSRTEHRGPGAGAAGKSITVPGQVQRERASRSRGRCSGTERHGPGAARSGDRASRVWQCSQRMQAAPVAGQ